MTDEPNNTPPESPPQEPASPAKPSKDVQDAAHKNAEYFARNPEVLDATLGLLEKAGVVHANQRIDQLEREIAVRDVIADFGLSKDDIEFIRGNTKEELAASATKLKARLDSVAVKPDDGTPVKPPVKPATPPVKPAPEIPALPDHRGNMTSVQQAEADLLEAGAEWCATFDIQNLRG